MRQHEPSVVTSLTRSASATRRQAFESAHSSRRGRRLYEVAGRGIVLGDRGGIVVDESPGGDDGLGEVERCLDDQPMR